MTKLLLEIPSDRDLDVLLPLLERLKIRFLRLPVAAVDSDLTDEELDALDRTVAEFEADPASGVEAFSFMKNLRATHVA